MLECGTQVWAGEGRGAWCGACTNLQYIASVCCVKKGSSMWSCQKQPRQHLCTTRTGEHSHFCWKLPQQIWPVSAQSEHQANLAGCITLPQHQRLEQSPSHGMHATPSKLSRHALFQMQPAKSAAVISMCCTKMFPVILCNGCVIL